MLDKADRIRRVCQVVFVVKERHGRIALEGGRRQAGVRRIYHIVEPVDSDDDDEDNYLAAILTSDARQHRCKWPKVTAVMETRWRQRRCDATEIGLCHLLTTNVRRRRRTVRRESVCVHT